MRRLLGLPRWLLGFSGVPYMSRHTFRWELLSIFFVGLGSGVLVPEFTQLFARKGLSASNLIVGLLLSEVLFGNVFGAVLGQLLRRWRRVRCVVLARAATAAMMLLVALLPARPSSAVPYALLLIAPSLLSAVQLNVTTSIWHTNYPADVRGQIFCRLSIVRIAAVAASALLAGAAMDARPSWAHRAVYPLAAAAMLASAWAYGRIRARQERRLLADTAAQPLNLLGGFQVLWRDRAYGRFMLWQMISGSMVLLTRPIILLTLTDVWAVTYREGTAATTAVPFAVMILALLFAGPLFDRVGITKFRAAGGSVWVASRLVIYAALVTHSWPLLIAGFAVQGLASGPGHLAFNIAHTRFAAPGDSQAYMGIHMTLNGLRGLVMPLAGAWLYARTGVHALPAAAAVQVVAVLGFALMKPPADPATAPAPPPAEDPPEPPAEAPPEAPTGATEQSDSPGATQAP